MSHKSRINENTQGGENSLNSFGGGVQSTSSSRTFRRTNSLENKRRGEPSGKYASSLQTDNINKISKIIQEFGGPKRGGENEEFSLGKLTLLKKNLSRIKT